MRFRENVWSQVQDTSQILHQSPFYALMAESPPFFAIPMQQTEENPGVARFQKVLEDSHSFFQQIFTNH